MKKGFVKIIIIVVIIIAAALTGVYAYNKKLEKEGATLPAQFEYEVSGEAKTSKPKKNESKEASKEAEEEIVSTSGSQPDASYEEETTDSSKADASSEESQGSVPPETVSIVNADPSIEADLTTSENSQTSDTSPYASSKSTPRTGNVNGGVLTNENGVYYITDSSTGVKFIIVNKTYDLPQSYGPGDLTSECASAFSKLKAAAKNDGINIFSVSTYRSYSYQNNLYNNYVSRDGQAAADKYSARAGHSEHQTGLAIDCNSLSSSWGETAEGQWLKNNCTDYGFIIRYQADKISSTGYQYEPWHIRYLGSPELAEKITNSGLSVEEYYGITSEY